jgi:uncharacterized membrane protein
MAAETFAIATAPAAARAPRVAGVDALRGFAVAQMIVYHFIYDLDLFGWIDIAMTRDQPWVAWRTAIVAQFLLLVGASLVLREALKPGWSDFWRRWGQIAASALLVSAGSWWLFGPRFIWFGILHFVAVALIGVRLLLPLGRINLLLGALVIAAGLAFKHEAFNAPATSWIGFAAQKPGTEDYVPLVPWLGVALIGAGLGSLWRQRDFAVAAPLAAINAAPPRLFVWLGRWPLTIYLLHQPVMLGLLYAVRALGG